MHIFIQTLLCAKLLSRPCNNVRHCSLPLTTPAVILHALRTLAVSRGARVTRALCVCLPGPASTLATSTMNYVPLRLSRPLVTTLARRAAALVSPPGRSAPPPRPPAAGLASAAPSSPLSHLPIPRRGASSTASVYQAAVTAAQSSSPPPSAAAAEAAAAAAATTTDVDAATSDLPPWAGADRPTLVYASLSSFTPVAITALPGRLFAAPVRRDLVHRTVHWQLACRRAGTAVTKSRALVAGTSAKSRPQKGSGRARAGARTSPVFRGGGVAHGPKAEKKWAYALPYNVRRSALRSVLTNKWDAGKLWVVRGVGADVGVSGKTGVLAAAMDAARFKSVLIVDAGEEEEDGKKGAGAPPARAVVAAGVTPDREWAAGLRRAARNLQPVEVLPVLGINVYDVLRFEQLVLTVEAVESLRARFDRYDRLF